MKKLAIIFLLLSAFITLQGQVIHGVVASSVVTAGAPPPPPGTSTLLTGLLAGWNLTEPSGNALDVLGVVTLVNNGATQGQPGKIGTSYSYTANDYTGQIATTFNLQKFTVSCWVNTSQAAGSTQGIVDNYWWDSDGWSIELGGDYGTDTKAVLHLNNGDVNELEIASTTSINDGIWHHIVAEFNGTNAYLYVDNVLEASSAWAHTITYDATGNRFKLGCRGADPGELFFTGRINMVRIWGRVLGTAGVDSLYLKENNNSTYPWN